MEDLKTPIEECELDIDPAGFFFVAFDDHSTLGKDVHVEIHKKIGGCHSKLGSLAGGRI